MKSFSVVALLVALSMCCYCGTSHAEDQLFGTINPAHLLIDRKVIKKTFMPGMVQTETYSFVQPATGGPYNIHAIKITDNKKIRGATAAITSGALGTPAITVTLTSKRGAAIKSTIEVYGAP